MGRIAKAAISIGVVAGSFAAPGHALTPEPTVRLRGVTTLSATRAGYVRVYVPRMVRFGNPLAAKSSFEIRGRGGFVGFALVPEDTRHGHTLLGGRLPSSAGGRRFLLDVGSFFSDGVQKKRVHIHKGYHRLYLLPGEGPATLKLTALGLSGETVLQTTDNVDYRMKLTQPEYATPGGNYYSAASSARMGGPGLIFGATWMQVSAHGATHADNCFWSKRPRLPEGHAPNCGSTVLVEPGGLWDQSSSTDFGVGVDRPFRMYYGKWEPHRSGFRHAGRKLSHTVTVGSASAIDAVGSMTLWLTYD